MGALGSISAVVRRKAAPLGPCRSPPALGVPWGHAPPVWCRADAHNTPDWTHDSTPDWWRSSLMEARGVRERPWWVLSGVGPTQTQKASPSAPPGVCRAMGCPLVAWKWPRAARVTSMSRLGVPRVLKTPGTPSRRILRREVATGLLRMQHGPSGPAIGQLDVREHQYALWFGLNPLKVCWGRSRTPPASMSAASRGRCRGSSRGCCGRLCGTRRAGHGPRGPLGPVGCGGGRGAPPCASHRPISTLERPSPAPWAAPEACLGIRKCGGSVWPLVGLWTSGAR